MHEPPTISAVYLFPIKSARAVALPSALVEERGLHLDRRWMVVNAAGRQITQREHPKLSLVEVELRSAGLMVGAPGLPDLFVPLSPQGGPMTAFLWRVPYAALAASPEADAWFSAYLGAPHRLAYLPDSTERRMNPRFGQSRVGFADGNPLHLISEASLADLNAKLGAEVPALRFRPNLIVRGAPAYAEDGWASLSIGETQLDLVEATARCSVVNVDPARGVMGGEPLRTLARHRRVGRLIEFGQNLVMRQGGTLSVGDPVLVTAMRGGGGAPASLEEPVSGG